MVAEKYTGDRLPFVAVYVVLFDDLAIGIIQAWQDDDARGLDMALVGEFQGQGIGPTTAHALARRLTSDGWRHLSADPRRTNARAVRAWQKAGFVNTGRFGIDDGEQTLLLEFDSTAIDSAQP